MAMASSASLDSVVINVESDASKAGDGLVRLTKQLQNLRESVKGGFNNLTKLARSLNDLKPASEGLATVATNLKELQSVTANLKQLSEIETPSGLTNTITRLKELAEISSTLEKTASNVSNVTKMVQPLSSLASIQKPLGLGNLVRYLSDLSALGSLDKIISEVSKLPQIVAPLQSLGDISSNRGMGTVIDNLERLPDIMMKLGDTNSLQNIGRVASELVTHLEPLSQEMQKIANGYSAISKMSDTYGVSAQTVTRYTKQQVSILKILRNTVSGIVGHFKKLKASSDDFAHSAVRQFQKVSSKIKQIGLSLLGTRTLFTMIRKAVSEYQAFDEELQKFSQNVWRAFGAQLAPIIEYVMYLFKQFVRVIYSVVLALTGIDLISRANAKAMAGWGKAAKDTLGNLQKFDDLNVVEFPKDSGGGADNSLIDLQTIDLTPFQKIIDWVKELRDKIKEALDTGKWYEVGRVFADGVNAGIDFLLSKIPLILETLMVIGNKFGEFLNGIIENVNWSKAGELLSDCLKAVPVFLSGLFGTINWTALGNSLNDFFAGFDLIGLASAITNAFGRAITGFFTMLVTIDWGMVAKKIGETLVSLFSDLSFLLSKIPWSQLGESLRNAILSIPWGDIWKEVVNLAKEAFNDLADFISGLTGIDSDNLYKVKDALVGIGLAFATYKIVDSVGKLATNIVKFGKQTANILKVKDAFSSIAPSIGAIKTSLDMLQGSNPMLTGSILDVSSLEGINGGLISMSGSLSGVVSALGGLGPTIAIVAALVAIVAGAVTAFKQLYNENENFRNAVNELGTMIKGTFITILEALKKMFGEVWSAIKDLYNDALKPLWDLFVDMLKPSIEGIIAVLSVLWKNVIDPLIDVLLTGLAIAFDYVVISIRGFTTIIKTVTSILSALWKGLIQPFTKYIMVNVVGAITEMTERVKNNINSIKNILNGLKTFLDNMITAMKGGWKSFANFVIEKMEWLVNKIISGFNWLIGKLNKVSIDVPDWVPGIGGSNFGFNISQISNVSLPRLETGTNEIEKEGIYHLHPGEAVIPKRYNPAIGGGTNTETNERLDRLITILNEMEFTNIVNIGNDRIYEQQQSFNKFQQNKYGTTDLY